MSSKRCIFKHKNPRDLAKKIDYFIEHEDMKKKIEDSYKSFADDYSVEKCMEKMEQMILETKAKKEQSMSKNK